MSEFTSHRPNELVAILKEDESSEAERVVLEKSVWMKLDSWLLPLCTISYLLSFLDRSNIGNARVAGLQKSLKLSNYEYTVALTVTFVPYIVAELPSNLLLKRIGPQVILPAMVAMWGVVCTLQGVVYSYSGLIAYRFFLGLMEGGLFPGLVLYLSLLYPRKKLQTRVATFFTATSLSGAFSGLLAAAIDKINERSGRPGWAWIFILEGIFTFLFGLISFFLLPGSPESVCFLSEVERRYVVSRLKEDGVISQDAKNDDFSWKEVTEAAKSPQLWLALPPMFFVSTAGYALAYFGPTIVAGLGYGGNRAQLMSVPPYATAFVCTLISAFVSDRYGCRGGTAIFFSVLLLIGFSMFHASESSHARYGSLFLSVTGSSGATPALLTWTANNSAPHVRRATSVAIMIIMGNAGGILATWLLGRLSPAPEYTKAVITFIIMCIGTVVFLAVNIAYLRWQNRLKAEKRRRTTRGEEPAGLGDRSAWFIYSL